MSDNRTEQLLEEINERGKIEDQAQTAAGCAMLFYLIPIVAFILWILF